MSNELYGVLVKVLKGVALCLYVITYSLLYVITSLLYVVIWGRLGDTTLISASRQGHVSIVRRLLKYRKTVFNVKHFQKYMWTPNRFSKKTAFDVAAKKGHVEIAKLLLDFSLEYLLSKRNHEGKLLVSMLNPEHDNIILDTFDKATNAAMHPLAITSITIHEEDLRQESPQDYRNSIMDPQSYPKSHKSHITETRTSLLKLDQGEVELTPNKNTILHLVSKIGHVEYAREILGKHPSLLYDRNSEGETPAYVAAMEGHVDILAIMISYFKTKNDDIETLLKRSIDNHTALHIAIQNHHVGVVFWLIKEIPQLVNIINDFDESPIYLAAERGYNHLLNQMLNKCQTKSFKGPKGKTALHAAAISGSRECINLLREEIDQKIRDEHGWTPFGYAVHQNNASATAELVDADPSIVNEIMKEDDINTFAVHFAASRGYCETLEVLMSHCPGCSELVDEKGNNIFHVAVLNKQTEVIELIHRRESYTTLVNKKDNEGNTPIHLLMASDLETMDLVMDSRVNINILNNKKLTPLDMASSIDKRKRMSKGIAMGKKVDRPSLSESDTVPLKKKDVLVVATLIATASFAAAFQVPGGFNGSEGSKPGMPILARKFAFQVFIFSNTMAFSFACSVLVKHLLIINYKSDEKIIRAAIRKMHVMTACAMLAMVAAFATGIYAVMTPYNHRNAIFFCVVALLYTFLLDPLSDVMPRFRVTHLS